MIVHFFKTKYLAGKNFDSIHWEKRNFCHEFAVSSTEESPVIVCFDCTTLSVDGKSRNTVRKKDREERVAVARQFGAWRGTKQASV